MDATHFLRLILPSRGLYIGLAKKGEERRQSVFNTIEQLLAWEEEFNAYGWDVYHAMASFAHRRGAIQPDGKRRHPRGADNALAYRSLFTDGDCKVSHPLADYNTQMEIYEAAVAFSRDARIPYPLPVNSGGGQHSYWPLREDIDPVLWKRLADALKRAHLRFKYHFDAKVTANGAQVLRTPGFRHQRLAVQVQVGQLIEPYDISQFMHLLEDESAYRKFGPSVNADQSTVQSGASIARAIQSSLRVSPSDPKLVVGNCCQVRRILTHPSVAREPEHRLACGVLKACDGGAEFYLSHLDADWRVEGQRKLDGWKVGPPFCASFEAERPGGCEGCYFFDGSKQGDERFKISSPTHAGRIVVRGQEGQAEPAPAQADREEHAQEGAPGSAKVNGHHHPLGASEIDLTGIELPWPFGWKDNHLVRWPKDPADKDAEPLVISRFPIYLASIHHSEADRHTGCVYAFRQWHKKDGWHTIAVPAGDVWSNQALPKLANGHANILQPGEFREYILRHVDALNEQSPTAQYEQCGWKKDDTGKRVGFVLGSTMLEQGRSREVVVSDEMARRAKRLGPVSGGSIQGWRAAVERYLPPHDWAGWWVILASLGSVFISFQHATESGGIVNVRELESGGGKTSKLLAGASAWGLWEGLVVRNYDTGPSSGKILSVLNHLPCYQDELDKKLQANSKNPEWLGELTNRLTEGYDKHRMEMGGKKLQETTLPYQTHLLTATNHPLRDYATAFGRGSDAIAQRIMELRSQVLPHLSLHEHEFLQNELFKNAGWAGYYMIEWILRSDENMAFVEKKLKWWLDYLCNNTNFRHKHRFTIRSIAAAAVAGEVCHEMGGMLPCDFRWVIDRVLGDLDALTGRERPDEVNRGGDGIAALGEFYNANVSDQLVLPGPYMAGTSPYEPPIRPRKLVFRIELSNHRLIFTRKSFHDFCIGTGYSFSDCMQDLENSGALVHRERICVLGAGTTMAAGRQRCIEIATDHPAMSGLPRLVEASNDR